MKTTAKTTAAETTNDDTVVMTTPTPTPSVQTITISGTVSLVTTYITPPAIPVASSSGGGRLTGGAIAGVAIGIIALIAIGAFLFYMYRRHRNEERSRAMAEAAGRRGSTAGMMQQTPTGTMSTSGFSGDRRSTIRPMDPRLDPYQTAGLYSQENISRDSIGTIRDDQDYSRKVSAPRQMRVMNPDPDP